MSQHLEEQHWGTKYPGDMGNVEEPMPISNSEPESCVHRLCKKLEEVKDTDEKIHLLINAYIPFDRREIYEFAIISAANHEMGGPLADAWAAKMEQAYQKARIFYKEDSDFPYIAELRAKTFQKKKQRELKTMIEESKVLRGTILLILGLAMGAFGIWAGDVITCEYQSIAYAGLVPFLAGLLLFVNSKKKEQQKK